MNPPVSGTGYRGFESHRPDCGKSLRCGPTVRQLPVKETIAGSTPATAAWPENSWTISEVETSFVIDLARIFRVDHEDSTHADSLLAPITERSIARTIATHQDFGRVFLHASPW